MGYVPEAAHGTAAGYITWKCDCICCKAAAQAQGLTRNPSRFQEKQGETPPEDQGPSRQHTDPAT